MFAKPQEIDEEAAVAAAAADEEAPVAAAPVAPTEHGSRGACDYYFNFYSIQVIQSKQKTTIPTCGGSTSSSSLISSPCPWYLGLA